jgi:hypothetical protein
MRPHVPPMAGTTYFESPPDFFSLCSALSRGTCSEPCATEVLMRGKPRRPELVRSGIAADLRAFPPWFDARRRRRRPRLTCRRSRKLSHPDVRCASLSARGTRDGRSMEDFLGKREHPISRFRKIFETAIAPDDSRLRVLWERARLFRLPSASRGSNELAAGPTSRARASREPRGKEKG